MSNARHGQFVQEKDKYVKQILKGIAALGEFPKPFHVQFVQEKDEYVEQILKDIAALGVKYDQLSYTSDFFPQLADCAERLIKLGHLYADDTPVDQMRLVSFAVRCT